MRGKPASALRSFFCCAVLALAGGLPALAQELPNLGDADRQELTPVMERKLGEEIMFDIRRNIDYLDDAPLLEYLNNFGAQLVAARPEARSDASYDFFFFAVRDTQLNAFALPGGFIAVHSALVLAAQSESELASVMAHEIGHVAQRHIARMLGRQRQDSMIPLAALVLAILASRAGGDAAVAVMAGSQGLALQRQLNFSREAEREADRIGFQILRDAGFDTSGMVAFFRRLQVASRSYSDTTPAYLRSHPLTTERMADIDARNRDQHYRQRIDNIDFQLIRARVRVLQDESSAGMREAETLLQAQLEQSNWQMVAAARYGLAFIALKRGLLDRADEQLQQARQAAARAPQPTANIAIAGLNAGKKLAVFSGTPAPAQNAILASLAIDIDLARAERGGAAQKKEAVAHADSARQQFPLSRGIARQYAEAMMTAGQNEQAVIYLRDQLQLYRREPQLYTQLAKSYAALGKIALQHIALAESYALTGATPAALDQLLLARKAPDASFYDQALIDARERELQARRRDEMADEKK
jgi:predicted Zn-dependent protease